MSRAIEILCKLEDRWEFFRKLRGDKWNESVEDFQPFIEAEMEASNCCEIEAALAIGKILADGGHDPNEVFAVAVELVKRRRGDDSDMSQEPAAASDENLPF